jgi:PASTA domain
LVQAPNLRPRERGHPNSDPSKGNRVIISAVGRALRRATTSGVLAFAALAGSATASASSQPPIKVTVSLSSHRVVAGQPISGIVVLTNTSTRAITVNTCAINGWLAVGLSGKVNSYPFGHTLVGCAPSIRIKPGTNRFPVRVITTYPVCTEAEPSGSHPTPAAPNCVLSHGQMTSPPLPAGMYLSKVDIVGLPGLTRTPNRVAVSLGAPTRPPALPNCAETPTSIPTVVTVPDVVGLSSSAAALSLSRVCLNAGYASPVGSSVVAESPSAGSNVAEYSTVTLTTR